MEVRHALEQRTETERFEVRDSRTWLVLVGAPSRLVADTQDVLESCRVPYLVPDHLWATRAGHGTIPRLGVVHGGTLQSRTLDALRWFTSRNVPALVLVEHLTDEDEALILGGGARDVVSLPTSPQRLQSRILAFQRIGWPSTDVGLSKEPPLRIDDLVIDPTRREASVSGEILDLTRTEFDLLVSMARDPGVVLSREELSRVVPHRQMSARSLETHLSRLRMKILAAHGPRLVQPVRGVGYRLGEVRGISDAPTPRPRAQEG